MSESLWTDVLGSLMVQIVTSSVCQLSYLSLLNNCAPCESYHFIPIILGKRTHLDHRTIGRYQPILQTPGASKNKGTGAVVAAKRLSRGIGLCRDTTTDIRAGQLSSETDNIAGDLVALRPLVDQELQKKHTGHRGVESQQALCPDCGQLREYTRRVRLRWGGWRKYK